MSFFNYVSILFIIVINNQKMAEASLDMQPIAALESLVADDSEINGGGVEDSIKEQQQGHFEDGTSNLKMQNSDIVKDNFSEDYMKQMNDETNGILETSECTDNNSDLNKDINCSNVDNTEENIDKEMQLEIEEKSMEIETGEVSHNGSEMNEESEHISQESMVLQEKIVTNCDETENSSNKVEESKCSSEEVSMSKSSNATIDSAADLVDQSCNRNSLSRRNSVGDLQDSEFDEGDEVSSRREDSSGNNNDGGEGSVSGGTASPEDDNMFNWESVHCVFCSALVTDQEPKLLPCLHSACHKCLNHEAAEPEMNKDEDIVASKYFHLIDIYNF